MDRIDELAKEVERLRKEVKLLRQEQNNTTYWRYDPSYTTYRPPQFPCEAGSVWNSKGFQEIKNPLNYDRERDEPFDEMLRIKEY